MNNLFILVCENFTINTLNIPSILWHFVSGDCDGIQEMEEQIYRKTPKSHAISKFSSSMFYKIVF